jgi:hypothetical protein
VDTAKHVRICARFDGGGGREREGCSHLRLASAAADANAKVVRM